MEAVRGWKPGRGVLRGWFGVTGSRGGNASRLRGCAAGLVACLGIIGIWGHADAATPGTPHPRQFSVLDGLPSNTIHGLDSDRQGYLWIATRDGLARYDGVGFRIWQVGSGLRENDIGAVHVDAQDRVWVGTSGAGLAVLDPDRRAFRHYDRASHPQIASNKIWSVQSAPDGALWFGTADGGLYRIAPDGVEIRRFAHRTGDAASLPADGVTALKFDRQGVLWIATLGGLARWDGRVLQRVAVPSGNRRIDGLSLDDAGTLWMYIPGRPTGRLADGRFVELPYADPVLEGKALHVMLQDTQGNRWLDTRSGLAIEQRGVVRAVPLYSQTSRGTVRPQWSFTHQDKEGGLWLASWDAGLWHVPANWRDFSLLTRRVDDPETPANAFVHAVAPSHDNTLWLVGSGGVLDSLDPGTGRIRHVVRAVCGTELLRSVAEAADRSVWVGCNGKLVRVFPGTGAKRTWSADDARDAAPAGTVQVSVRPDGSVWATDDATLQVRDREGRIVDQLRAGDGRGRGADDTIRQIATAPDGGTWIAGSAGLSMWNAGTRRLEPVPGAPRMPLAGFALAARDRVWLAGTGMLSGYRWDGERLHPVTQVGPAQGLPLVMPAGVAVDGSGDLWAPTLRGLVRYDPQRKRLRVYGVRDGLPSQEFSKVPIQISPLGYVALGTADGLLLFHPRQVAWREGTPTLAIAAVDVRRDERRVELPRSGTLVLEPDDRDLRVVARLLSFTNAHAHRYRFRLRGYDRDWVHTGASGERLLASLTPGRYRLEVQARTADGDWSASKLLELRMPPPWWRTPWAMALFALTSLLLLGWAAFVYRVRLKRRHAWQLARQRQSLAEQASEAKTRFLATLGHEVRTPMTGVLGMSELLLASRLDPRQRGQVESIQRAGEHLLRLVNDALDLSRIEAGKLQLDSDAFDLRGVVRDVAGLMAPLAERRGLAFADQVDAGAPVALQGDRTRVVQILMNLIGNAIKFTERGFVSLEALPLAGGGVRFAVADSGPGLSEEQQQRLFRRFEQAEGARTAARYGGSGLGLAISQELAAAMGGRIDVESTPGKGTRFIVDLPLPTADLSPAPAPGAQGASSARASLQSLRVLLVEDDPTVADVLVGLLKAQGHDVVHAAHGLAALAEAATRRFDIGLLDLDLPGIDGLALARQLRAQGFAQPLVAVTARADAHAEPLSRAAGFDGFLRKPLTGAMLAEGMEQVLVGGTGAGRADDSSVG
jgi:signal transduction histidine kinase/sugar lactone lactonase YvrE/BarA-like signal transduction histidine kinase